VNLYIDDDDSVDGVLVQLLRAAGHDVVIPHDIGTPGAPDAEHMLEAIQRSRVLLTKNHDDFEALHRLALFLSGHHPGILVVRADNNPKHDMSRKQIVRAIRNFVSIGVPVADGFHILNNYR
jgi:predicted nuclease of predicted toxin-antitoxin system